MKVNTMRKIKKIIVHCSATEPSQDIGVEQITGWHIDRGFSDIGYHFVIKRNGDIQRGRPLEKPGAHTYGHNEDSIGICLVGGTTNRKPQFNFTLGQIYSLEKLISHLAARYPSISKVTGHNEYSNKDCPCFNVKEFFGEIQDSKVL